MGRRISAVALSGGVVAVVCLGLAGIAAAVSGGGYQPSQQDCSISADSNTNQGTEPGCHNAALNVEDGNGTRYAEVGTDQLPQGSGVNLPLVGPAAPGSPNFPHSGCAAVNTAGTGGGEGTGCGNNPNGVGLESNYNLYQLENGQAPVSVQPDTGNGNPAVLVPDVAGILANVTGNGLKFYFGLDDNNDFGEHDGANGSSSTLGSQNGPSDGGGIGIYVMPAAQLASNPASATPTFYNPLAIAGAYEGFCADGVCSEVTTSRQVLYQGCSPDNNKQGSVQCSPGEQNSQRNVYDYTGKKWDPYNCSSGDVKSEQACLPPGGQSGGMDAYRQQEAHNVYAEPGVQVYEDPDPQASPFDPLYEAGVTPQPSDYPLPSAYVGTCGVAANGQVIAAAPGC